MKKALIVFSFIFMLIAILLLIRGNEDDWICENGKWTKHGNPSAPMPTSECK